MLICYADIFFSRTFVGFESFYPIFVYVLLQCLACIICCKERCEIHILHSCTILYLKIKPKFSNLHFRQMYMTMLMVSHNVKIPIHIWDGCMSTVYIQYWITLYQSLLTEQLFLSLSIHLIFIKLPNNKKYLLYRVNTICFKVPVDFSSKLLLVSHHSDTSLQRDNWDAIDILVIQFTVYVVGGHSAEWYPPVHGYPGVTEDLCGHWGTPVGQSLGSHGEDVRLHQPHGPPRGSGEVASVHAGEDPPPPPTDHLPDQPQFPPGTALLIDSL